MPLRRFPYTPGSRPTSLTEQEVGHSDPPAHSPFEGAPISTPGAKEYINRSGVDEQPEQVHALAGMLELLAHTEHGREMLTDALWSGIPKYVFETNTVASDTSLTVNAQHGSIPVVIRAFTCWSSTEGTPQVNGFITFGNFITIPVNPGFNSAQGLAIVLNPDDVRSLTCQDAGLLSLSLYGEALPTFGRMS